MEEDHGSVTEQRVDSPGMVGLVAYHDLPKAWPLVREYIVAALAAAEARGLKRFAAHVAAAATSATSSGRVTIVVGISRRSRSCHA